MLSDKSAKRVKDTKVTLDARTADLAAAGENTTTEAVFDYIQAFDEHKRAKADARNEMQGGTQVV